MNPFARLSLPLFFFVAFSGCNVASTPTGPEQHEQRSVELGQAELVRVKMKMPVGELDVHGGASKLMDGDFTYNVAEWKPEVTYNASGGNGDLTIETHGPSSTTGNAKNHWDLRFSDRAPIDMSLQFGAGEARLNLGSLALRNLDLEIGAGTLKLDLRGKPVKDYSVRIRGGVGETTVYLPNDVGISATATGGIGDVSVTGLRKTADGYKNDAYDSAPVKIHLDVKSGVGSIKLVSE